MRLQIAIVEMWQKAMPKTGNNSPSQSTTDWGGIPSGNADQPPNTLAVYIPDAAYWEGCEGEAWDRNAAKVKAELESAYELPFDTTDIGPGFSIPAFITLLQNWGGDALALFLLGKHLTDGWGWWSDQVKKLKPFFKRKARFPRDGAAVLAMKAIVDYVGHEPSSIRLVGYTPWNVMGGELDLKTATPPSQIENAAPDLWLGVTTHFYLIEVDGRLVKVAVEGSDVTILEV